MPNALIVEDDLSARQLLCAVALRNGFHPVFAGDGDTALYHLLHDPFEVILLDLMLPKLNGFEVLRHISCVMPHLLERTIVVTAVAESTYANCPYVKSVRAVLRKPCDLRALDAALLACTRVPARMVS